MLKMLLRLYGANLRLQTLTALVILANAKPGRTLQTTVNQSPRGLQFERRMEHEFYSVRQTIEDGIERVVYTPHNRRIKTPLLLQHGMWHGAWCWDAWGALFAEWGWEVHAHSLPGHSGSFTQRPLWRCTMDYYLAFLKAEVDRLPVKPVIIGHSMGGGLIQWYLKHVADDLPAAVLLASMVHDSALKDGLPLLLKQDPFGLFLSTLTWNATPWMRTPYRAAQKLISHDATIKPVDLHAKLGGESLLAPFHHNPPFWSPPQNVKTPLLWVAPEKDTVVSAAGQRRSAAYYGADYIEIADQAHNLMMERTQAQTARKIHDWLVERGVS